MKILNLETGQNEDVGFMESRMPLGSGVMIKGDNKFVGKNFSAVYMKKRNQIALGCQKGWFFADNNKVSISLVEGEVQKSVIKRAVVGGILTGGVGAVVGGLSGLGTKKKKKYILEYNDMLFEFDDIKLKLLNIMSQTN